MSALVVCEFSLFSKLLSLRLCRACQEFHRSLCVPIWLKGMQSR